MKSTTYQDAGVDTHKADHILESFAGFLKSRPKDPNLISGIGPYASCYSLKSFVGTSSDPVLVTCCDGVGTKLKLALEWDDISGLGFDLLAMNVNDLLCAGAKPLLFLDYYGCGKLEDSQLSPLLKSIQQACEVSQCTLAGGETAELPGLYADKDFDLAGFAVGVADRSELFQPANVKAGDKLVAFPSSGFHSNGYSLIRKVIEGQKIQPQDKTPFDPSRTWKQTLLAPTTIYVPWLVKRLGRFKALAHLTGGGLLENLPRVLPPHHQAMIQSSQWDIPPLFRWFQEKAGLSEKDLLSTFNCGVGMVGIVASDSVGALLNELVQSNIPCKEVGVIETSREFEPVVSWR